MYLTCIQYCNRVKQMWSIQGLYYEQVLYTPASTSRNEPRAWHNHARTFSPWSLVSKYLELHPALRGSTDTTFGLGPFIACGTKTPPRCPMICALRQVSYILETIQKTSSLHKFADDCSPIIIQPSMICCCQVYSTTLSFPTSQAFACYASVSDIRYHETYPNLHCPHLLNL